MLASFKAPRVWTSDSSFAGTFDVPKPAEPWHKDATGVYDDTPESAIRFSRVPPAVLTTDLVDPGGGQPQKRLDFRAVPQRVRSALLFVVELRGPRQRCAAAAQRTRDRGWRRGRRRLGAYHHRGHAVHARAVLDKLRDYLPVGQIAVIIPDPKLNFPPPTLKSRS